MNHCGIYCLESPDGEFYVGQSRNILRRIKTYKIATHRLTQSKLKASLIKHGFEAHKASVLAHLPPNTSQEDLDISEIAYINIFKSMGKEMLNMKRGGGAPMYGKTHSEETKKKFSDMYKGEGNPNYGKGCFGTSNGRARHILQYDLNGGFIREWDTITNASKATGIKRTTISSCLIGLNKQGKGFIWKYKA